MNGGNPPARDQRASVQRDAIDTRRGADTNDRRRGSKSRPRDRVMLVFLFLRYFLALLACLREPDRDCLLLALDLPAAPALERTLLPLMHPLTHFARRCLGIFPRSHWLTSFSHTKR